MRISPILLLFMLLLPGAVFSQLTETDSPEAAKIRQIETDWANAIVKKDQFALDLALAPTYVDISATGEVTTKDQQIARLFVPADAVLSYNETLTSIRIVGDTALAQGTYTLRRKFGSEVQEERGIFTHVYQKNRESWQCINNQRTVVREQTAPPRKTESHAEMPFHVPFTGHKKKDDDSSSVTMVQPTQPAPATGTTPAASQQAAPAATPTPEQAGPPTLENVK